MADLIELLRAFEGSDELGNGDFSLLTEAATEIERLRAEVERLRAEVARLEVIAGYGGVSSDAPERLILASEVYDGVQSCDKWCDVRRVVDDGQPMPESATAYVRADRAERLAEALREARDAIEDWAGYASDYFREKHDLAGDLAKIDALLRDQEEGHEQ